MLGLFKRKDPICGMKEEKNKGFEKSGSWFCSKNCLDKYEKGMKTPKHSCCH